MLEYAMLRAFPIRYVIRLSATDRQRTQQVWLVGLSLIRQLPADATDQNVWQTNEDLQMVQLC